MNNQTTNRTKIFEKEIVNGPSKDTLFDACKYAYNSKVVIPIGFKVALGYTAPKDDPACAYVPMSVSGFRISAISHEDGSGESFSLSGCCHASLDPNPIHLDSYEFVAYYNSKTRKGTIKFISN